VTSNGVDCLGAGGWVVPYDFLPPNFLTSCGVATGHLCCVPATVQTGPQCGGGGTRNADGRCSSGWEVLTVNKTIAPNPILNTTNALCQVVLPVEVLHYQVHQLPDPSYPHPGHLGERRFLVVRRNDEVDNAGNPLWVPVASDIEDLQICYEVQRYSSPQKGPACDPPGGQELGCFRWTWNPTDLARPEVSRDRPIRYHCRPPAGRHPNHGDGPGSGLPNHRHRANHLCRQSATTTTPAATTTPAHSGRTPVVADVYGVHRQQCAKPDVSGDYIISDGVME
jgi:hypothetical protein